jgi:hypothetical protein
MLPAADAHVVRRTRQATDAIPCEERLMGKGVLKPTPGIQKHVDRLLKDFDHTDQLRAHPSFHFVASWCEVHSEEAGLHTGETGDSFTAVHPETEADSFSDDELRDHLNLPDETTISDSQRVEYMRRHLAAILDGETMDADVHPTGCTIRLRSTKGREACLGYEIRGYSFSGVEVTWLGVFASETALRENFKSRGFLTSIEECNALDDQFLLTLWQD